MVSPSRKAAWTASAPVIIAIWRKSVFSETGDDYLRCAAGWLADRLQHFSVVARLDRAIQ
jgi:hypothetical protein